MAAAAKQPWSAVADGVRVTVRVTPKASRAQIGGLVDLPDGRAALKVHVNAPPEGGKANAALLALLAKSWRLPKTALSVTAGTGARTKTVHIAGAATVLLADLSAWLDNAPSPRQKRRQPNEAERAGDELMSGQTNAGKIIDGKAFAAALRQRLANHTAELASQHDIVPGLTVVLVGEDPASQVYVRSKGRQAEACGMHSNDHRLPADTTQAQLLALVEQLNRDPAVHGILVQLPLPPQIDPATVINTIAPGKDVDGFHVINTGRLATGQRSGANAAIVPCTPLGALMLLRDRLGGLAGLDALVLGRSNIVGKPMAQLLIQESCTVTVAHSRTRDLAHKCRAADILVAAVGRPEMVRGSWIKPGATVIDVGINRIPAPSPEKPDGTRLVGDVAFAEAIEVAGAITPVPGGIGPMTIACLLANTLTAACRLNGLEPPQLA